MTDPARWWPLINPNLIASVSIAFGHSSRNLDANPCLEYPPRCHFHHDLRLFLHSMSPSSCCDQSLAVGAMLGLLSSYQGRFQTLTWIAEVVRANRRRNQTLWPSWGLRRCDCRLRSVVSTTGMIVAEAALPC